MKNDSREQGGDSSTEDTGMDADEDVGAGAGEGRREDSASDDPSVFRQPFLILSCLLIVAAAVLLLLSLMDMAFVVAALGVSAWFWNMRVRLKRQHGIRNRRER